MVGERTSAELSRAARLDGMDGWGEHWTEDFRISQNEGAELIAQGTNEWIDYWATVLVNILLAKEKAGGTGGGLRRSCALVLGSDCVVLLVGECD